MSIATHFRRLMSWIRGARNERPQCLGDATPPAAVSPPPARYVRWDDDDLPEG